MPEFPGFPSNDFDFHFQEVGGALAGLVMRDINGRALTGVFPSSPSLLSAGTGWTLRVSPFVAVREKNRAILLGGTSDEVVLDVDPAPSANSRIDVVYSLPADVESGDPVRGVAVATGIPGPVPSKPSLPEGAIEIGTYRSTAGELSAAAGMTSNTFRFSAAAGGRILVRTKAALNSLEVMDGTLAYVLAEGLEYTKSGNSWVSNASIAARVYRNGDQVIPGSSATPIVMNRVQFDTSSLADLSAGGLRLNKTGLWLLSGQASFGAKDTLTDIDISIASNIVTSSVVKNTLYDPSSRLNCSGPLNLNAGTLVTLNARGRTSNGSDARVYGQSAWNTWVSAVFLG